MTSSPDWSFWSEREEVRVFEALALMEGQTPGEAPPAAAKAGDQYNKRLRSMVKAIRAHAEHFPTAKEDARSPALSKVKLQEVASWALAKRITLPERFPRKARPSGPALLAGREPVVVRMTAPYYGLPNLVEAVALALSKAALAPNDAPAETIAAAWEQKLRDLAHSKALKGHSFDDLKPARDWTGLDIERDCFFVDDLNACIELKGAGLRFEVVRDERADMEFEAGFAEAVLNDNAINWTYWVEKMGVLLASEAARLMSGLDPDLYKDLSARPTRNDTRAACTKAFQLERLALRQGREQAEPLQWLEWAKQEGFAVHAGFVLAVMDKVAAAAAAATPAPANSRKVDEEAPDWKTLAQARAREIYKRQRALDLHPSQQDVADEIAKEFRRDGVFGPGGKPLTGTTIKRHSLKGISSAVGKQLSTAVGRSK